MECKWLPDIIPCKNWLEFIEYQNTIYKVFKHDFIDTSPYFEGLVVNIRKEPKIDGFEQAFFHVTSKEYVAGEERCPDPRRCERIRWIRAFIENYHCNPTLCDGCDGIKVWEEQYKMYKRVHLLFEEENYMVLLERREKYALLITAYYFDYSHALEKQLKKYEKYKEELTKRASPK